MRPLFLASFLAMNAGAIHGQVSTLPVFPEPQKILTDDKQFNAVTLGPGNTFTVRAAPADYQLEAFDFSADEARVFLEWQSGRLETRDISTGKRISESRPISGPLFEIKEDDSRKQLVAVTPGGAIRFIDSRSGKMQKEIQVEKGRFNYDIQRVLVAPDGSWLAYLNQDNGKVLDLSGPAPKVLADLGDGYDLSLSADGKSLWVVSRVRLFGFNVDGWNSIGTAELLDQVRPDGTTTLAVLSDQGNPVAFIPSKSGLLRYDLTSLRGHRVTEIPTYWVAAARDHNELFVHEYKVSALYGANGAVRCGWQIRPAQDFKVSPSGRWLGDRNFGKVELWSTQALVEGCTKQ